MNFILKEYNHEEICEGLLCQFLMKIVVFQSEKQLSHLHL